MHQADLGCVGYITISMVDHNTARTLPVAQITLLSYHLSSDKTGKRRDVRIDSYKLKSEVRNCIDEE